MGVARTYGCDQDFHFLIYIYFSRTGTRSVVTCPRACSPSIWVFTSTRCSFRSYWRCVTVKMLCSTSSRAIKEWRLLSRSKYAASVSYASQIGQSFYSVVLPAALAACTYLVDMREKIFRVLYNAINSSSADLQAAGKDAMRKVYRYIEREMVIFCSF